MKAIALTLALFMSFEYVAQCSFSIRGKVIDEHDKSKVELAKISIKGSNTGAFTDSLGFFEIKNLCSGNFQLMVSHHLGCKPLKHDIYLVSDTVLLLSVEFHLLELQDVNVDAFVLDRDINSIKTINAKDRMLGNGKSVGDVLSQIPGVTNIKTGVSIAKPVVRGMHSNRLILMNNGVRQEGQQWGSEHAPEVDPFFSEKIALYKGAEAVQFGPEAIAAVILMESSDWSRAQWSGDAMSGFESNGRGVFGGLKMANSSRKISGLKMASGLSFKKYGDQNAPEYLLSNTSFNELNYFGRLAYSKNRSNLELYHSNFSTELGILAASHLGNLSDLKQALQSETPLILNKFSYKIGSPKQTINHRLSKLEYKLALDSSKRVQIDYSYQFNNRYEFDEQTEKADFQLNLNTHQGTIAWEQTKSRNTTFRIGINGQYQENLAAGRFLIPNYKKKSLGAFVLGTKKWNNVLIEGALRADLVELHSFYYVNKVLQDPKLNFNAPSANIGFSRLFGHHWIWKANTAYSWRPPSISELYSNGLHHGSAAIEIGNPQLTKETAFSFQSTGEFKSNRFRASLDVFQYLFKDYIYLTPSNNFVLTIKGAFPEFKYKQVDVSYSGLEASFDYQWAPWLMQNLNYGMVRVLDLQNQAFIYGIAPDQVKSEFKFYPQRLKKSNMKSETGFAIGVGCNYIAAQNRVEPGSDFINPPKDVFLFNANVQNTLNIKNNQIVFSLNVDNILNNKYRSYLNRYRYFTDELGRSIRINIHIKF